MSCALLLQTIVCDVTDFQAHRICSLGWLDSELGCFKHNKNGYFLYIAEKVFQLDNANVKSKYSRNTCTRLLVCVKICHDIILPLNSKYLSVKTCLHQTKSIGEYPKLYKGNDAKCRTSNVDCGKSLHKINDRQYKLYWAAFRKMTFVKSRCQRNASSLSRRSLCMTDDHSAQTLKPAREPHVHLPTACSNLVT